MSRASAQDLDWVQNAANGRWYAQTPGPTSWTAAEALAQRFGGHLVTVNSAAENAWLDANFFGALTLYRHHWIGLFQDRGDPNYAEPAGGWKWASGEPFGFANWAPGSPDNAGGHQDFARSTGRSGGPSGEWQDDTDLARPGFGGFDDWYIAPGEQVVFNTATSVISLSQITFVPGTFDVAQATPVGPAQFDGGVVEIDDLVVEAGAILRIEGPNAFLVMARGNVIVRGRIDASGFSSHGVVTLNTTNVPELGAAGHAGGGNGGTGSPLTTQSSPLGDPGFGAFQRASLGGQGGEAGWSLTAALDARRGAGGGGGTFGANQPAPPNATGAFDQRRIGLDAERGFDNLLGDNGAISGPPGPFGGAAGASPFADGDPSNDFYGLAVDRATGAVVVGELVRPWAGAGGGGGGDATRVLSGTYPPPFSPMGDEKGAGGGGGGGSCHVMALGSIVFGPNGQFRARGGTGGGGENTLFLNRVGGGSGGGSGGHVVLQSATRIDLRAKTPITPNVADNNWALDARGGQGGAGASDIGGATLGAQGPQESLPHNDACPPGYPTSGVNPCRGHVNGAGGDGGPGVIQMHTPLGMLGVDPRSADILVAPGAGLDSYCSPLPIGALVGPNPSSSYFATNIGAGLGLFELDSADCDGNGVPDSYEIAASPSLDVDGDGVLDPCDATVTYCTSSFTSLGCTPFLRSFGVPSASASSGFELVADDVIAQRLGQLFYGLAPDAAPFGAGVLCVAPPIQRLSPLNSGGSAATCGGELREDWNAFRAAHPSSLGSPFAAGQTFYAQAWFRDVPTVGLALSNAHRFTLSP